MADEQDVLQPNPGGYNYSTDGQGDERGEWGGRGAHQSSDGSYQGGFTNNESGIPMPNDPAAYNAQFHWSPSGRQEDVDRYRGMGEAAANRPAYQLNYGAANQSLGQAGQTLGQAKGAIGAAGTNIDNAETARLAQYGALEATARAANGQQPSRAEILGKSMIGQSLRAQVGGAASARGGPLAQMAARRQVAGQAAGFQAQGTNQLSALRADEMERARSAWMSGATGIRSGDYQGAQSRMNQGMAYGQIGGQQAGIGGQQAQMAQSQGNMEMGQRQLNQQGQMGYEQLGWNTNNSALNAGMNRSQMEQTNYWNSQGKELAERQMDQQAVGQAVGAGTTMGGAVLDYSAKTQKPNQPTSDVRAKQPATLGGGGKPKPLLLDLGGRQPKAANPNWLDAYMEPEKAKAEDRKAREEHDARMEDFRGPSISRDDPYAGPTPGGITRQDPYAELYNPRTEQMEPDPNAETYFSDDQTKLAAAFTQGANYAGKQFGKTPVISSADAPSYVFDAEHSKQTGPHDTKLSTEEEQKYQAWKQRVAPRDSGEDYDFRGAYKSGEKSGADGHWHDTFKKPNHETFSDESKYATGENESKAGHWNGDVFTPYPGAPNDKTLGALRGTSKALNSVRSAPTQGGRDPVGFRRDHGSDEPSVRQPTKFTRDNTPALVPSKGGESKGMNRMSPKERASPNLGATSQIEADANRKLAGSAWTYKPEHAPPGDDPNQLHYGGMAQNYEQNPITKTAVRTDPKTGLRQIDMPSMMMVQGSGIASLQKQVDELKGGRRG